MVSYRLLARKTLRELRRTPAQTAALVLVLALGVTTFIAAVGAYRDLQASETRTFEQLRFADVWFKLDPAPEGLVRELERRAGVEAAAGRLVVDTGLPLGEDRVRARLIGVAAGQTIVNDVLLVEGAERRRPRDVLVEQQFAAARGIEPGDTIAPLVDGRPFPLQVTGIVASPEYLQVTPDRYELLPAPTSFAVLFLDRATLQQATGSTALINDLALRARDDDALRDVETALRERGGIRDVVRRDNQATYAALAQDLTAFRSVAYTLPTLILLAGVLSVAVLLGRIVRSQRPTIGVMKALGYTDRAVLVHYLTYAAVIASIGTAVGLLVGSGLGVVITRGYAQELGIPLTDARLHPVIALVAAAVTLLATVIAALHPAWRSARLAPAVATRIDIAAVGVGRRTKLERLAPVAVAYRIPLRALTRARAHAASTAAGILAAVVLVLTVLGLRDGIDLFLRRTFDELERWDVSATFGAPPSPASVDGISLLPGIRAASPFLQLPARVETATGTADILLTALEPGQRLRTLRLGGTSPARALTQDRVVLTDAIAEDLNVGTGDTVRVGTALGARKLRVGGTSDEPVPARGYVSLETAARAAGATKAPVNGVFLRVREEARSAVRAALYDRFGAESVKVRSELRADLRSLLAIFNALIAVMLAFAVAMAFALAFNAMTVNVLEREREFGTMRALGARPSLIGRLLLTEATLLWAIALGPGLLLGTLSARRLGDAVAADLFDLPVEISVISYLATGGGILVVIGFALLLAVRRIRRLDLVSATKTLG